LIWNSVIANAELLDPMESATDCASPIGFRNIPPKEVIAWHKQRKKCSTEA
jgi:hypothetical protein